MPSSLKDSKQVRNSVRGRTNKSANQDWRPPTRASREVHTRRLVTAVALSLVVSAILLWLFARVAGTTGSNLRLGDSEFKVGGWKRTASQIDKNGPIFFNDLVRDDKARRPLVLTHLVAKDFAALNALPPGSTDESCVVRFDRKQKNLVDPCTSVRYALDGKGIGVEKTLDRFVTEVSVKGALSIDLNRAYPEELR